tara:strand:- start:1927 stop:2265 length:339 start_codon:yes stop_codon:yes gene_type:complete
MALKGRKPTGPEADRMADVAELGCIVCFNQGIRNLAEIHHIDGKTKKGAHLKVLPLCYEHHRKGNDKEPISRHPYKKRFETAYGTEEKLLEQVDELLKKIDGEYDYLDNLPF